MNWDQSPWRLRYVVKSTRPIVNPPSGRYVHVDTFFDTARKRCNNFLINNHPTQISSINNNDNHSLNEHAKDNSVTIKEADKGGAIVLFNARDYINRCENHLSDTTNYKNVKKQTLKEFMSEAKKKKKQSTWHMRSVPQKHATWSSETSGLPWNS